MPEKYYVAGLDRDTNSVIVARGSENPALFARGLSVLASEFNWVAGSPPAGLVADRGRCSGAEAGETPNEAGEGGAAAAEIQASGHGRHTKTREAAAAVRVARASERRGVEAGGAGEEADVIDFRCQYRCRHRQELLPCTVEVLAAKPSGDGDGENVGTVDGGFRSSGRSSSDGESASRSAPHSVVYVRFDEPAKAIAPGQVVALYKDGVCLGGGPIRKAEDRCAPVLVRTPPTVMEPPQQPISRRADHVHRRPTDRKR